ncbi:hypothetical protein FB565_008574 [Actinoplanes lutulentus]|uniref:Uncharacterized protein n=1 Tax=Actinoplanes lutulentus TaxID=1287878 RepID=A0A327Z4M9_9ACTN|nr:hypothetical protein [Actinoplanes lutulentus]RAK29700.1 hypothetical protein B0I29_11726 [Actinoplanes lutulentus]
MRVDSPRWRSRDLTSVSWPAALDGRAGRPPAPQRGGRPQKVGEWLDAADLVPGESTLAGNEPVLVHNCGAGMTVSQSFYWIGSRICSCK